MEAIRKLYPILATVLLGAAHGFAWRSSAPSATWLVLGAAYTLVALLGAAMLAREEALKETFEMIAGDVSRGIAGGALIIVLAYGGGIVLMKISPAFMARELGVALQVRAAVPVEWQRALAVVVLVVAEELIFRAAVTHVLEEKMGSVRAPWVASALCVVAALPSLRPSVIAVAVATSAVAAFLVARFRRPVIAMVSHAAFAWVALELVLPILWQRRH
ncbi:MAG: CPBP family glutamic-type intramembrane protease [Polyangiales bacterium]